MLLESERLSLRPVEKDDLDDLVEAYSDPDVTEFLGPLDRLDAARRLVGYVGQWEEKGYGMFSIRSREDQRFLGMAGLDHWPRLKETELGWILRREEWGQGFAFEAALACAEWGLDELGLPYLIAMIKPANLRSIALARRLGMSLRRHSVLFGDPVDVYAVEDVDSLRCLRIGSKLSNRCTSTKGVTLSMREKDAIEKPTELEKLERELRQGKEISGAFRTVPKAMNPGCSGK